MLQAVDQLEVDDHARGVGAEEDYYDTGEFPQDILENDLIELGGQALLDRAHAEAAWYVDEFYPWDGRGEEPPERVSAHCAVLWQVAEEIRTSG